MMLQRTIHKLSCLSILLFLMLSSSSLAQENSKIGWTYSEGETYTYQINSYELSTFQIREGKHQFQAQFSLEATLTIDIQSDRGDVRVQFSDLTVEGGNDARRFSFRTKPETRGSGEDDFVDMFRKLTNEPLSFQTADLGGRGEFREQLRKHMGSDSTFGALVATELEYIFRRIFEYPSSFQENEDGEPFLEQKMEYGFESVVEGLTPFRESLDWTGSTRADADGTSWVLSHEGPVRVADASLRKHGIEARGAGGSSAQGIGSDNKIRVPETMQPKVGTVSGELTFRQEGYLESVAVRTRIQYTRGDVKPDSETPAGLRLTRSLNLELTE